MIQQLDFKKLIIIIISTLVVFIAALSFLVNNTQTKLKRFEVIGGVENASVLNQKLEFKFNTPISKSTSKLQAELYGNDQLTEIEIKEFIVGENIILLLDSNLEYNTNYKMELEGIKDSYQKDVTNISVDFKTKAPGFYYLEHANEISENTEEVAGQPDKIIKYDLNNHQQQNIYEAVNINNYAVNNEYMAVVVEEKESTNLTIVDMNTNDQIENIKFDFKQIGKLAMTQEGNRILFTLQEYEFEGEFVIPTTGYEVFYYDIDTKKLEKFEYGNIAFDVSEIVIAPGGDYVLVEDATEGFYLIDLNNPDAGIPLGRFISTGGFSADAHKILFLTFEPENMDKSIFITYYDIEKGQINLTKGDYEVIDPRFFNKSDMVVYSREKAVTDSRGIYRVVMSDLEGHEDSVFDEDGYSLEYPRTSYDDKYLIVEKYSIDSLQEYNYSRSAGYLTKPDRAELVVYNLENKEVVVDDLQGIEAKWVW